MESWPKLWATLIVWLAVTVISTAGILASAAAELDTIVVLMIVFGVMMMVAAAGFATARIWGGPEAELLQEARKRKDDQPDRVARLLDDLDDDEIVELELLLGAYEQDRARQ